VVVDRNHGFNGLQVMGLYIGLRGSEVEGSEEQGRRILQLFAC
jgi:hypothetical protein